MRQGRIRAHHFGEGEYDESEQIIQKLLAESGPSDVPAGRSSSRARRRACRPPPTRPHDAVAGDLYRLCRRADNFASPGGLDPRSSAPPTAAPAAPAAEQWALAGAWTVGAEKAVLEHAPRGKIVYRFYARDLHLVLGPRRGGKPVRFRVSSTAPPGASHGADTDASGAGTVSGAAPVQLIRQSGEVGEHMFSIEFLDPGVQAYSFTFG